MSSIRQRSIAPLGEFLDGELCNLERAFYAGQGNAPTVLLIPDLRDLVGPRDSRHAVRVLKGRSPRSGRSMLVRNGGFPSAEFQ
jgi:hypothetical protein